MLTKRNLDVHIRKCWRSIGPGEITASYLRTVQTDVKQRLTHSQVSVSSNPSKIMQSGSEAIRSKCDLILINFMQEDTGAIHLHPRYCKRHTENKLSRRITAVLNFPQLEK